MERPEKNKKIGLNEISIGIDGLTTAKENFVYTCSTVKAKDGDGYEYNYEVNKTSGVFADIIKGAPLDDKFRSLNAIRNHKNKEGNLNDSETVINLKDSLSVKGQLNGSATEKSNFIYNEGFSKTLANGQYDEKSKNEFNQEYKNHNNYDEHIRDFSDQLTKVRSL